MEFTKKPLERLEFVIQTGGNNAHVVAHWTGLESVSTMALLQGRKPYKLTQKGVCRVFGEDKVWRGDIILDKDGCIKKVVANEYMTFGDMYQEAK